MIARSAYSHAQCLPAQLNPRADSRKYGTQDTIKACLTDSCFVLGFVSWVFVVVVVNYFDFAVTDYSFGCRCCARVLLLLVLPLNSSDHCPLSSGKSIVALTILL